MCKKAPKKAKTEQPTGVVFVVNFTTKRKKENKKKEKRNTITEQKPNKDGGVFLHIFFAGVVWCGIMGLLKNKP